MPHQDWYLSKAEEPLFSEGFKTLARQCHSWPDPVLAIILLKSGASPVLSTSTAVILGSPCTSSGAKGLIVRYLIKV